MSSLVLKEEEREGEVMLGEEGGEKVERKAVKDVRSDMVRYSLQSLCTMYMYIHT